MAESTTPQPQPLAESRLDGCPQCVYNTELPKAWLSCGDFIVCSYVCADCGNHWLTSWGI